MELEVYMTCAWRHFQPSPSHFDALPLAHLHRTPLTCGQERLYAASPGGLRLHRRQWLDQRLALDLLGGLARLLPLGPLRFDSRFRDLEEEEMRGGKKGERERGREGGRKGGEKQWKLRMRAGILPVHQGAVQDRKFNTNLPLFLLLRPLGGMAQIPLLG